MIRLKLAKRRLCAHAPSRNGSLDHGRHFTLTITTGPLKEKLILVDTRGVV